MLAMLGSNMHEGLIVRGCVNLRMSYLEVMPAEWIRYQILHFNYREQQPYW